MQYLKHSNNSSVKKTRQMVLVFLISAVGLMWPTQFGRQCLPNLKSSIELSYYLKVRLSLFAELMTFRSNTLVFIFANSFLEPKKAKEETLYIYFLNILFVSVYETQVTVYIFNIYWHVLMFRRIKKRCNLIHGRKIRICQSTRLKMLI